MVHQAKLAIAALLALIGLGLIGAGLWLAVRVGPAGTATFTARPSTPGAVLLTPTVLNSLDADVLVTARAADGGTVWLGRARPSEAELALGDSPRATTSGYDVSTGTLRLRTSGEGEPPVLANADIWRSVETGTGSVGLRVSQDRAPESVVITSDQGRVATVTVTVERRAWFVQAVVATVVGLLLAGGALALWRLSRRAPAARGESVAEAAADGATSTQPAGAPTREETR